MRTSDTGPSSATLEFESVAKRVGLALGLGVLLLVFVPLSAAVVLALVGGDGSLALGLLAVGLLGLLMVLLALPLAMAGVAVLVGLAAVSALRSAVTERRIRALRRMEALEESRWWGAFVRPSEWLSFLDPRSAAERLEASVEDAKSRYVSGELSEVELERRLHALFELETDAFGGDGVAPPRPGPRVEQWGDRREAAPTERLVDDG